MTGFGETFCWPCTLGCHPATLLHQLFADITEEECPERLRSKVWCPAIFDGSLVLYTQSTQALGRGEGGVPRHNPGPSDSAVCVLDLRGQSSFKLAP